MSKTAEEILKDHLGDLLDPVSTGTLYGIVNAMEEYASLRSKELQERVEIWIDTAKKQGERIYELEERLRLIKGECNRPDDEPCNITYIEMQVDKALSGEATREKDESLEAYNRECKRVDELTEEIAVLQSRLKSEYERGYNQGMVEAAKEL